MNMSITKVGNVARKSLLPLAAAGALIAGAASCKSNQKAEAPKSEIELCREAVAKAQEKCYKDSIAFEQADSILAKQRFSEIRKMTENLPMSPESKTLARYKAAMGDKIAEKSIEVADKFKPLYEYAQNQYNVATGKALENSKQELIAAENKLVKAQRVSLEIAKLDIQANKVDGLEKQIIKDVLSQMSKNSAESEAWLQKIYDRN